jgi:COP9 signalosome complex subunit 6
LYSTLSDDKLESKRLLSLADTMAGKQAVANPLVISGKALDTANTVQLHPIVLLTISDYITRHTIRRQSGFPVGSVIGQQNGRNITLESAYECRLADGADKASLLDGEWFLERLAMFKEVHKVPALDLTAIFMIGPVEGPQPEHLAILQQVQQLTSIDNTLLLLFHPDLVDSLTGGKLPISLYEPVQDQEGGKAQIRFRELSFEIETDDAEMISVDFVAKGPANATAVSRAGDPGAGSSKEKKVKGKGKGKEADGEESESANAAVPTVSALSAEDEELISSLNAKVNAIKMLDERLNLLRSYLESLPKSYLTSPELPTSSDPDNAGTEAAHTTTTINHPLLRSMNALLSRLPLLAPPPPPTTDSHGNISSTATPLAHASLQQTQDVQLTALLTQLTSSVADVQALAEKFGTVQRERTNRERVSQRGGGLGRFGHDAGSSGRRGGRGSGGDMGGGLMMEADAY